MGPMPRMGMGTASQHVVFKAAADLALVIERLAAQSLKQIRYFRGAVRP
jgi:hypothetical protein